jgi:hypothetical protein
MAQAFNKLWLKAAPKSYVRESSNGGDISILVQ